MFYPVKTIELLCTNYFIYQADKGKTYNGNLALKGQVNGLDLRQQRGLTMTKGSSKAIHKTEMSTWDCKFLGRVTKMTKHM